MPSPTLTVFGLSLDILGAMVLATPDVPSLSRLHEFGQLRIAEAKLQEEGVKPEQDGYNELVGILETLPTVATAEEKPSCEYQVVELRRRTGYAPSNIDFRWG